MDDTEIIILCVSACVACGLVLGFKACRGRVFKSRRNLHRLEEAETNQQEDVFNISSRVQGQGQWPTHDAHVSLDHFMIASETNKHNDAPPTYEEAMSIATAINNSTAVPPVVPKTITVTSTSASTTTSTVAASTTTSTTTVTSTGASSGN